MFLHILGTGSMFTKDTYAMISTKFEANSHCFTSKIPDHDNFKLNNGVGCKIIKSKSISMLIHLYKCDYIIIHGLLNKLVIFLLAFQPWMLKKCNWIIWGGDLYCHNNSNKSFIEKITEKLRKFIIPRFSYVTTVVDNDYSLAQKWYGAKGLHFKITYPVPASSSDLFKQLEASKSTCKDDIKTNILIGNSATETNQHIQVLDNLAHLKNENIHIFLPLSYGTGDYETYGKKVLTYAQSIFGDKVTALTEQLDGTAYLHFLNKMDIGLFNNNRQQGLGNISQLILTGAKVYIRKDTEMWPHFQKLECVLYDIEQISSLSLAELKYEDKDTKLSNIKVIKSRHSMDTKVKQWKYMFDAMESRPIESR